MSVLRPLRKCGAKNLSADNNGSLVLATLEQATIISLRLRGRSVLNCLHNNNTV